MITQPPGLSFSRQGPVQRTSITNILVCKPKRNLPSLSEFLEIEENDLNEQVEFCAGTPDKNGDELTEKGTDACQGTEIEKLKI